MFTMDLTNKAVSFTYLDKLNYFVFLFNTTIKKKPNLQLFAITKMNQTKLHHQKKLTIFKRKRAYNF